MVWVGLGVSWQDDAAKNETWVFLSSKDGDLVDRKATEAIFEKHKPTLHGCDS